MHGYPTSYKPSVHNMYGNQTSYKPSVQNMYGYPTNSKSNYQSYRPAQPQRYNYQSGSSYNNFQHAPTVVYKGSPMIYGSDTGSEDLPQNQKTNVEPKRTETVEKPPIMPPLVIPSLPSGSCQNQTDEKKLEQVTRKASEIKEDRIKVEQRSSEELSKSEVIEAKSASTHPEVISDPNFAIPNPKIKQLFRKIMFEVNFTEIDSPSHFWFQYAEKSLDLLMNNMHDTYSILAPDELAVKVEELKVGLVVAAKVFDAWHRAQVALEPNTNGEALLFFVDFGTISMVNVSKIRYLLKGFGEEPVKALRGSMVGVCPKDPANGWSHDALKSFINLTTENKIFASIRFHRENENIFELDMNEQVPSSVNIVEALIDQGFAQPEEIKQSLPYAILLPTGDIKIYVA